MCAASGDASPSILGISFDGLAISGIVNQFLDVAAVLGRGRFRVLCDLGYDITMGRTHDLGWGYLPGWVQPVRCIGSDHPAGYTPDLVQQAHADVVAGTSIAEAGVYEEVCRELASRLVQTFVRENVRLLVVENGTLPDNPLFTEALLHAIGHYGASRGLGKYVFWRDHDLMWSAEPQFYGPYPYPGVRKPLPGEHIHYVVTTDWMRRRVRAWSPSTVCHVVPYRFHSLPRDGADHAFRAAYGIPESAYVVARCTRVVPQKSIERDLHLFHEVQLRLAAAGDPRRVYLVVSGPTGEEPEEFARLRALERTTSIAGQVVWADGLLAVNAAAADADAPAHRFTIRDLLAQAQLSSFLTTYDYEGFGMPPGEAMALGVPFISTTYELYPEVYGSKGAVAPLWTIGRASAPDDPVPPEMVDWTIRVLTDAAYRAEVTARNLEVVRRFFSMDALTRQLRELFGDAME